MEIRRAEFPADGPDVLEVWREYLAGISVSLAHQGNGAEFSDLPGKYAGPGGCLLLASGGDVAGCIAFRDAGARMCEMKRLYVRPRFRGVGLGSALIERLIIEAREACYREIRLDVLEEFGSARRLYGSLGFTNADPVTFNPLPGTAFLGLRL